MSTRTTRASAAKAAALHASTEAGAAPQQLSSPPSTPLPKKKSVSTRKTPKTDTSKAPVVVPTVEDVDHIAGLITPAATQLSSGQAGVLITPQPEGTERWVELPHNLGRVKVEDHDDVSTDGKKAAIQVAVLKSDGLASDSIIKDDPAFKDDDRAVGGETGEKKSKKRTRKVKDETDEADGGDGSPKKKTRKLRTNPYGFTYGETPYPDWPRPTPEECYVVDEILTKLHGPFKQPKTIPVPSQVVTGCGEVPCVVDALIRTLLSANTTNHNSSMAFQGLIKKFGVLQEGVGKGSLDYNAVRLADTSDIEEAIKRGGMQKKKSHDIKAVLNMVYEENQARREALLKAEIGEDTEPLGANNETKEEKEKEVTVAEQEVLTLDHYHAMETADAFNELIKLPSIGVKTAMCVLLFNMQRPSFAVDTHIYRLCKWLGWVPPNATRDTTANHLDVKMPDELKYSLHQLFIRHGQACGRCRAITGESSEGWDEGCVIDHLVTRTGVKKGGEDNTSAKKRKASKGNGNEDASPTKKTKTPNKKMTEEDDSAKPSGRKGKAPKQEGRMTEAIEMPKSAKRGKKDTTVQITSTKRESRSRKVKMVKEETENVEEGNFESEAGDKKEVAEQEGDEDEGSSYEE